MENEPNMPDDFDDMGDVIIMNDEDGNEHQLHVLATKEGENCVYLLTALAADDDEETSEVLHFKCAAVEEDDTKSEEEDDMALELVDEGHEDFELVMDLFKADYENLGIIIDEEDSSLGVQEK